MFTIFPQSLQSKMLASVSIFPCPLLIKRPLNFNKYFLNVCLAFPRSKKSQAKEKKKLIALHKKHQMGLRCLLQELLLASVICLICTFDLLMDKSAVREMW